MKLKTPCVPWYLPINDTSGTELCTPWEAREFRKAMDKTPGDYCDHCLPDCTVTIYEASVTAAPFRNCDYKNLGVSYLCDFDGTVSPKIWGQQVQDQYANEISSVPFYIVNDAESSLRKYAGINYYQYQLLLIIIFEIRYLGKGASTYYVTSILAIFDPPPPPCHHVSSFLKPPLRADVIF